MTKARFLKVTFLLTLIPLICDCASEEKRYRSIEEQCFRDLSVQKETVDQLEVEERWDRAIKKLGEIRSIKAIPFLVRFIRESHVWESISYDNNVRLVFHAAESLGRIGKPALPEIKKLLIAEDVMQRRFALCALSQMEENEAVPLLRRAAIQDRSGRNRREALEILSKFEGNRYDDEQLFIPYGSPPLPKSL
jgi:hypothetical protein